MAYVIAGRSRLLQGVYAQHLRHFDNQATKVAARLEVCAPLPGAGYLAGEFPDGLTTVEGAPVSAAVLVRYRAAVPGAFGDGALVGMTQSAPDGTWLVPGLNASLRYNVEARHVDHNDAMVSGVQPVIPPP